eukprot:gene6766-8391_t
MVPPTTTITTSSSFDPTTKTIKKTNTGNNMKDYMKEVQIVKPKTYSRDFTISKTYLDLESASPKSVHKFIHKNLSPRKQQQQQQLKQQEQQQQQSTSNNSTLQNGSTFSELKNIPDQHPTPLKQRIYSFLKEFYVTISVMVILHYINRLSFYDNYWEASTTKEILSRWSKPVHSWLFRHVLTDLKTFFGLNNILSLFITVTFSGVFHEVLVSATARRLSFIEKDFDLIELLHSKEPMSHPFPFTCLPKIKLGRTFLTNCKRFVLQFVFVKPIIAIISLILEINGYYGEGEFRSNMGYVWLTVVENISVGLSLYYLVLYYKAMEDELKPFKPLGKFLCIKSVIFFSFWQGVAISFLVYIHVINATGDWTTTNISTFLQDFITCVEMLIIAICHHFFFTYKDYRDPNKIPFLYDKTTKTFFNNASASVTPIIKNFFTNVTSISDVISDTKEIYILPLISPDSQSQKEEEKILLDEEDVPVL